MNRLPVKFQLLKQLNQDQAIQAIVESTGLGFDVFTLTQACADAGVPATITLPKSGTQFRNGSQYFNFGDTQAIRSARRGSPYNEVEAVVSVEAQDVLWETSIDLRNSTLLFSTTVIRKIIDRLLDISDEQNELNALQQELDTERLLRRSLEAEIARFNEKPLDTRERASLERLIYVLAHEAKFRLIKPHADEEVIKEAAARLGVKIPTGKGTIAKYLEAAKCRAEADREP